MDIQTGNISDMLHGMEESPPSSKKKVLVVDDDQKLVNLLDRALTHFGFEFFKAGSVAEAMRVISQDTGIDIVLLDWNLPGMNGLEFLKRMRALDIYCPVVMMSGRSGKDDVFKAIRSGVDYYAVKPLHISKLIMKMNELVAIHSRGNNQPQLSEDKILHINARTELTILDLSRGGCAFESTFPVPVDSVVFLDIEGLAVKLADKSITCFPSRVCNCRSSGRHFRMGCQFVGLTREFSNKLDRLCSDVRQQMGGSSTSVQSRTNKSLNSQPDAIPKILVVDDDQNICEMLCRLLKMNGFESVKVGSGTEAVEAVKSDKDIKAVILDWMMPDMDGLVVLQNMKEINRCLAVVMLTAKDTPDDIMTAMEYGAADYIIKPMDKDDLIFKLKNVLHAGEYEPRERTSPRRKIVMQAFTSFMISHIDPKKLCFASTFPIESGSLVFVYSSDLNETLDIEREKRFSVKVGKSQGYGNHHMVSALFYSLAPDVLERIEKFYC